MMSEEKDQQLQNNEQEIVQEEQQKDQEGGAEENQDRVQAEVSLWKDQCKRISAEFENFKKRTQRDQARWAELARENVLKDILSFVDDFERALKQESSDSTGIQMLYNSLLKILEKNNVTMIKDYQTFDPEFHEAVMQVDSQDHESGQIVEVFCKGFMIQGRVLRPAQVSVAQ